MKIVCESCGAKYSIADEKVAGKVFKIRCKKCSAVIVVKGETQSSDESTRVYDYGGETAWHVVVDGEQQGPFAPRQIGELLAEGKIDWEAYVWREGMDGWQPAKDVEPLVSAVMADAEGQGTETGAESSPGASAYGSGQVFGGTSDMGDDPFSADDGGLSGVMQGAASASAAGGSADLFAKSAESPFAGGAAEEASPAAAAVGGDVGMTGERNENSVLFSLSSLQALATGSGGAPDTSHSKPGMAGGEGSGLIDIRALANMSQGAAEKPNGASKDKVEDLLSVGAGPAFNASAFVAPVAVEKKDSSKAMMAAMGMAILLLGGAVAYLAMRPSAPVADGGLVAEADQGTAAAPEVSAQAAAAAAGSEAPSDDALDEAEDEPEPAQAADSEEAEDEEEDTASGHARSASKREHRSAARKRHSASSRTSDAKPASAPEPAPEPAPKKSSRDRSIDDLLGSALGGGGSAKAAPKASASANLPATPSRNDVLSAMKAVTPGVKSCGKGGVATAKVKVSGSSGRVSNVAVSGQFAGTPAAACITKQVKKARFPKFKQSAFTFSFPFQL